jgi:hypothetical protein
MKVAVVGDDLYVRSYRGRGGAWFRGTQVRHEGHIKLAASRTTRAMDERRAIKTLLRQSAASRHLIDGFRRKLSAPSHEAI